MAPEPGADQVLVGRQRRLDVDEADDPVAELGVVEDAAERRVLDVAVAVDEAGHDDRPARGRRRRAPGWAATRRGAGPTATMRPPAHGDAAVRQHGRRHRQHPVGAVDRDVVVRCRSSWLLTARGRRDGPARRWSIGEPRAQWQTAARTHGEPPRDDILPAPATGGPQRAAGTGTEHLAGRRHQRRLGRRQGTAGRLRPLPQPAAEPRRARPPRAARPGAPGQRRRGPGARDPPRRRDRLGPGRRRRGGRPAPAPPTSRARPATRSPASRCTSTTSPTPPRESDRPDAASSDLLAPCCATCVWWLTRPGAKPARACAASGSVRPRPRPASSAARCSKATP